MTRRTAGLSILEILISIVIIAILVGIAVPRLKATTAASQENGAVSAFTLMIKNGASYAGSRKTTLALERSGAVIRFVETSTSAMPDDDFQVTVPASMTVNVPQGRSLTFGPTGFITNRGGLPNPVTLTSSIGGGRTWQLSVSTIGEVRSTP
ncbi:hypothetical protein [Deinococcus soli (ex Cha et al. 2016)]|uniref:Type II secretory pathway pseudopilin PulG n=2 Tax=Deinococcus soli (ex Cha et al. 2016) TaxID=1309411 RepID=A0ACC6KG91_9DEIO|nr:hypothetical protein [Deinococcus soli (ex Cha et al. 2016)]MDR6218493.1 type II secretory pathway pseudopilin PulG [Deinococcus soli (ex Cha et al. 2016)]MDR6329233.1 type II secretory pathway pseudopilin PulG [Deinococcus soli (ex Cha et al. 2016)]MDR6751506.1 type II secretory pathway pseudopilin PulG [Deinococcus soli (ex Cha et al. 2016)]